MELKILRADDQVSHIALAGKFDLAGVQLIEMKFTVATASRHKPAIVDMSEVSYLASLGVRVLLSSAKALAAQNVRMVLLNPQPSVLQVIQLGKLDSVFVIETDLDKALATVGVK